MTVWVGVMPSLDPDEVLGVVRQHDSGKTTLYQLLSDGDVRIDSSMMPTGMSWLQALYTSTGGNAS